MLFLESAFWAAVGAVKTISCYPLEQKKLPFLPSADLEIVNMFLRPVGQRRHCPGRHAALCGGELATCSPALIPHMGPGGAPLRWPPAPSAPRAQKGRLTWEPPCSGIKGRGVPSGRGVRAVGKGPGPGETPALPAGRRIRQVQQLYFHPGLTTPFGHTHPCRGWADVMLGAGACSSACFMPFYTAPGCKEASFVATTMD